MENVNSFLTILASLVGLVAVMLSVGKWIQEKESTDVDLHKRIKSLEERLQRIRTDNGDCGNVASSMRDNDRVRSIQTGPIPPDGLYGYTRQRDNNTGSESGGDSNTKSAKPD